jgi:hypothetical protein
MEVVKGIFLRRAISIEKETHEHESLYLIWRTKIKVRQTWGRVALPY